MDAEDYIAQVKAANPKLFAPGREVKIKSSSLEAVIKSAFEAGVAAGKDSKTSLFDNIFGTLVGKQ